nr:hypothetical protein CFP56_11207 [Quercus suber]
MAPVKGRIGDYVQQKNASASNRAIKMSLESTKLEVPLLGRPAQTPLSRARDARAKQEVSNAARPNDQGSQVSDQKFYDTEASNIENSSTNTGPMLEQKPTDGGRLVEDPALIADIEATSSDGDSSEDELSRNLKEIQHHPRTDRFDGKLNPSLIRKLQALKQTEAPFHIDGNRLGYLDGDTYPSQTSGPPSQLSVAQEHNALGHATQRLPAVDFSNRQLLGDMNSQQTHHEPYSGGQDPPAANSLAMRTTPRSPIFGSPKPRHDVTRIAQPHDRALYQRDDVQYYVRPQQPDVRYTMGNQKHGLRPIETSGTVRTELESEQHNVQARRYDVSNAGNHLQAVFRDAEHQPVVYPVDSHILQNDRSAFPAREPYHRHNFRVPATHQTMEENNLDDRPLPEVESHGSPQLDYSLPELYGMQYADIKAQDFDKNPNYHDTQASPYTSDVPLSDKLDALFKSSPTQQALFFDSLKIDEWEEAGDWFLDRFGDVVRDFRVARQKKRKAARCMEDDIEQRHEAVVKKRQTIELTLDSIRATGAAILSGTPQGSNHARSQRG